jgi:arginase family enzyme
MLVRSGVSKISPPLVGGTFLKSRQAAVEELDASHIAVLGIPYEGTKMSRLGCKDGPRAIREATFMFAYLLQTLEEAAFVDPRDGTNIRESKKYNLVDVGDVGIIAPDVHETSRVIREAVRDITKSGAFPVLLGGDHYISYPCLQGFLEGLKAAGRKEVVGYIHIDAHLDLADDAPFFGKLSSGTQVRRMIDTAGLDPNRMLMIGIGGVQPKAEWDYAKESGIGLLCRHELQSGADIGKQVLAAAKQLADCTAIYLTIDIDVNDRTFAPGTGNAVGAGGLFPIQFFEVLTALRSLPLAAVDLVEVAPNLDPTGRTASLAATALMTVLDDRLFERKPG